MKVVCKDKDLAVVTRGETGRADAWMTPLTVEPWAVRPVKFNPEWNLGVATSPHRLVFVELPRRGDPAGELTGAQLRQRMGTQVCIPIDEDEDMRSSCGSPAAASVPRHTGGSARGVRY
jgi:hypothetical protein